MKTLLLTILISALTAFVIGGKSTTPTIKTDALERVKQTGVLRCGYIEYPPYLKKDPNTGAITGILPDMMNTIAAQSGLKVDWAYETTWATALTDLNQGRYDAMCSGIWSNSNRAREALMSEPIGYSILALFGTKTSGKRTDRAHFLAVDGTYDGILIQRNYKGHLTTLPATASYGEVMESVALGKADFALLEPSIVEAYNRNTPKQTLVQKSDVAFKVPVVLLTALGEQNLRDFLNAALLEMKTTGAADAIWKKYNTDPKTPVYLKP